MTTNPRPSYRPVLHDDGYEPPRVLKIVEVQGPSDSRLFSEQCVVDVPGAEDRAPEVQQTPQLRPVVMYESYLPMVLKPETCKCHAVCTCQRVLTPTPSKTPTRTRTPRPTRTPTRTPCSCHVTCGCNPQTYYHCVCNPQSYYHCICNPQTYWW
jgi:hypothetical protein